MDQPKLRGLLVDDEQPILNNLFQVLPWEAMNIEIVKLARNGAEALAAVEATRPHLILSDIRMPRMDGLEMLRQIRERDYDCEVLLLTGFNEFEYARSALRYGVKDYISKPIDYEELAQIVGRLAGEIRKRQCAEEPPPQVLPQTPEESLGPAKRSPERLMQAAETYIRRQLGSDFGIEETAAHLGISASYFCLLFKNHFHETFVEYLTRQRMDAAKSLLLASEVSIARIGAHVGYQERRYFTKVFQKYTGMTPSEFRTHHTSS
ncbi:response regulator transcription factor [Paenibacillus sp. 1P07SE]|uniref:response regulator transcription factor n=1 Tax=Paenibacillus sp. 1P07SE TaxID=3132209 RepID=UPI0039A4DE32